MGDGGMDRPAEGQGGRQVLPGRPQHILVTVPPGAVEEGVKLGVRDVEMILEYMGDHGMSSFCSRMRGIDCSTVRVFFRILERTNERTAELPTTPGSGRLQRLDEVGGVAVGQVGDLDAVPLQHLEVKLQP
jgi:hypothetical protein